MLLIPGLMSSGEVWNDLVSVYGKTHRLHVVTLPGFAGQPAMSPGPVLSRVRDSLTEYIREERLNRPVLVGHSVGGFLAFWIAAAAPDLVSGVVSVDGVPFLPALRNPAATQEQMKPMADQMMTMYRSLTPQQLTAQARMSLAAMITAPSEVERATGWASRSDPETVGRVASEMSTMDLRSDVAAIEVPVLLIGAAADAPDSVRPLLTAAYEAQVAKVPRATVVMAPRARHFIMLDDPTFLYAAIDRFLAALPESATPR